MYDNENNGYSNSDNDNNGSYYNSSDNNSESYYNSTDNNAGSYHNDSGSNNSQNNANSYYNAGNNDYNPKKKKNKKPMIIVAVVVAAMLLIGGLVFTIASAYINYKGTSIDDFEKKIENRLEAKENYEDIGSTKIDGTTQNSAAGGIFVTDVSSVVESSMPSVVAITSKTLVEQSNSYADDIFDYYFGNGGGNGNKSYEQEAAGSGIIVDQTDTELLIVTNNHVVEGADSLKIQFNGEDSKSAVDGYIKGTDPNADIAVVAVKLKDIKGDTLNNIKKATLGDSDSVKVGEGVIAIGNALGYGQSVTTGVISAKDREAAIENKRMKLLQTDAAINGGNSGGALLNSKGEVIGINVAKYSSNGSMTSASVEGMGFAIPISSVKSIISTLETKETRAKLDPDKQGYLGITGYDVTDSDSQQFSIPQGVYVYSVAENGPADKAGIENSDVITKFDGQTITTMTSLHNLMAYYKPGEKIKVSVFYRSGREYKEKEVTVTLTDKSVTDKMND